MHVELQISLPRDSRYVPMIRNAAASFLADLGVPTADVSDVEIVLSEACANVVRHAVDCDEYRVEVVVSNDGCDIVVRDGGPGFGLADLDHAPDAPPGPEAESGRGLALISALVDDVRFEHAEAEHAVRLHKAWDHELPDDAGSAAVAG